LESLHREKQASYESLTESERWRTSRHPSIESDYEVATRFIEALAEIAQENFSKTVLVGAHGGTIRTMLIQLGYATSAELPGGTFENAGYVELAYRDGEFTVGEVVGANKITAAK
jgi:broad specificity phosphatase PhoE